MGKQKDLNASTNLMLRGVNCKLIDDLKNFTGENTASKAILLCLARYLMLEKNCDEQLKKIRELESERAEMKRLYKTAKEASNDLNKLMQG